MVPVLEAVPNFSEGRDLGVVRELVRAVEGEGAEVLDWSADADHHRSVITFVGDPSTVEAASLEAARIAVERIDLRTHEGVHPRIGALDVLPFVPLMGLEMDDAVRSARRVGERLATELGVPVYFYREASRPSGRRLAELRRGGFEASSRGMPGGGEPDLAAPGHEGGAVHPTAGATCVGARPVLLAWNVQVEGVGRDEARRIAGDLRETGGGFPGVRALALELPRRGALQVSMNVEDVERISPFVVFEELERRVVGAGGRVTSTEVIGMMPEALVLSAAGDRLKLSDDRPCRHLPSRLTAHVARRAARDVGEMVDAVREADENVPASVRRAADRLAERLTGTRSRDPQR